MWGRQNEPRHDKTNKMSVHLAKTQISLDIRPDWPGSSLCTKWVANDPSFLHADSEDWSDWADTQADPSLRWAYSHFVGFDMRRPKSISAIISVIQSLRMPTIVRIATLYFSDVSEFWLHILHVLEWIWTV